VFQSLPPGGRCHEVTEGDRADYKLESLYFKEILIIYREPPRSFRILLPSHFVCHLPLRGRHCRYHFFTCHQFIKSKFSAYTPSHHPRRAHILLTKKPNIGGCYEGCCLEESAVCGSVFQAFFPFFEERKIVYFTYIRALFPSYLICGNTAAD